MDAPNFELLRVVDPRIPGLDRLSSTGGKVSGTTMGRRRAYQILCCGACRKQHHRLGAAAAIVWRLSQRGAHLGHSIPWIASTANRLPGRIHAAHS